MNKFIVYKVTFPNDKVYIGISSKGLEFRKNCHYKESKRNRYNQKFYNALNKYKTLEIWETIDESAKTWKELCDLERYYIQKYNSFENGYNCSLGGDGNFGHKHSEESRIKMSGPRPQTTLALKGKPKSKEHKKKLSEARKNFKYTREQREQHSKNCGGKSFVVFKNNIEIGKWYSKQVCAEELNLTERAILGCLNQPNIFKSHKGCTFKYIEEIKNVTKI